MRVRHLTHTAILMAACLGLNAQTGSLEQAWAAAAKGDRGKAIAIARATTKREPDNADAHLLLGSLLMEQGEREAIDELKEGVRLQPGSADGWNALGEAYNAFGNAKAALEPFEKAVSLNPNFGIAQSNLGAVLLQQADTAAAAGHLDRAIQLLGSSPDAADAHYLRSKICNASGEADAAQKHLEAAVKLRPDFAVAWSDLGEVRRVKLDAGGALAAFERAVELNPNDSVAQYRLGAECLRREQTQQALEHLEAANKLAPEDQSTLNALQTALRLSGQPVEAERIKQLLASVLRARDLKSQANLRALKLNNQGTELEKEGNLLEAVSKYREALSLEPGHNGIRVNYAAGLLRVGRWTEGLDQLHQALQNDPDNREIQIALRDAVAQAPRATLPAWAKTETAH